MIDIKLLRENPNLVKKNLKNRYQPEKVKLVDDVLKLDEEWRKLKYKEDGLRSERNKISEEINELRKKGKNARSEIKKAKEIPKQIENIQDKRKRLEDEIRFILYKFPNMLDKSVQIGKEEKDNKELRKWGKKTNFSFKLKGHADIIEDLDLVDLEKGGKTSGSRFYYLKKDLVLLNNALQRFAIDFLIKKGYIPIQPPYLLNKDSMSGAVSFEDFEESIYKIDGEDLYLIGTSEHALAAYHKGEVINIDKPIKYLGLSSCFRKEAGSHGKDTKGIFRVHRFEKVEQFVFCKPEDEKKVFDEIINNQEEIFKLLEIPYKIAALCSGEFSGTMAMTYDLEGWFPAQNKYRELGSTSTARDYQSRKLNIRYDSKGKKEFVYTLNGTAMTVQRTMCCILENGQQKDGSIKIPKVLWPYMGKKVIK